MYGGEVVLSANYAVFVDAYCDSERLEALLDRHGPGEISWSVAASRRHAYALVFTGRHPEELIDLVGVIGYSVPRVRAVIGATLFSSAVKLVPSVRYRLFASTSPEAAPMSSAFLELRGIGEWYAIAFVADGVTSSQRHWRAKDTVLAGNNRGPIPSTVTSRRGRASGNAASQPRYDAVAAQAAEIRRSFPTHVNSKLLSLESAISPGKDLGAQLASFSESSLPPQWIDQFRKDARVASHEMTLSEIQTFAARGMLAWPGRTTLRALTKLAASDLIPLKEIAQSGRTYTAARALLSYDLAAAGLAEADAYCETLLRSLPSALAAPPTPGVASGGLSDVPASFSLAALSVPFQSVLVACGNRTGMTWRPFLRNGSPVLGFVAHQFSFTTPHQLDLRSFEPMVESDFPIEDAVGAISASMWLAARLGDRPHWHSSKSAKEWADRGDRSYIYHMAYGAHLI